MRIVLIFLFIVTFCGFSAWPQSFSGKLNFEDFSVESGFRQSSSINCILQDSQGYLWLGTWEGLFRYDGFEFKAYTADKNNPNSIQGRKIRTLFEDSRGTLWIGIENEGLHRYNREKDSFSKFLINPDDQPRLGSNYVIGICEDREGSIWLVTKDRVVHKVQQKNLNDQKEPHLQEQTLSFLSFPFRNFHVDSSFVSIYKSSNDILWIGGSDGIATFDLQNPRKDNFKEIHLDSESEESRYHNIVNIILGNVKPNAEGGEEIWIGTMAGLKKITMDSSGMQLIHFNNPFNSGTFNQDKIKSLYQTTTDGETFLWVGTDAGLYKFDKRNEAFITFTGQALGTSTLEEVHIYSMYEDFSGVLWMGTEKGLYKLDRYRKKFIHINDDEKYIDRLSHHDVKDFSESLSGDIWIATNGGGINRLRFGDENDNTFHITHHRIDISGGKNNFSDIITSVFADHSGSVWVGTKGDGVYRFHENDVGKKSGKISRFTHYGRRVPNTFDDDYTNEIYEDRAHNIWIGTWQRGLTKYNPATNQFTLYNRMSHVPKDLNTFPIIKILEDHSGRIWLGTKGGGLYAFRPGDTLTGKEDFLRFYKTQNGEMDKYISDIYEDSHHNIWVASESGLCKLDNETGVFRCFTSQDGLQSDFIQSIVEDDNENLWVSTNNGLFEFPATKSMEPDSGQFSFRRFDVDDGLQGDFFNQSSCLKARNGLLLFGGINGFNIFNPADIKTNPIPPKVVLTNFQINHEDVAIGEKINGRVILTDAISNTSGLTLTHKEKILSFEFAGLHFASPERNQYAYKMVGFDEDWVYKDASQTQANYTNLKPGSYVFKVKASNNDGVWSEAGVALAIHITPPFWLTGWAYFLYFIAGLGLLFLVRSLTLMRANFRYRINLERVEREKSEELNRMQLRFFTNISHEIRTPLTLILGPLEKLAQSTDLSAKLHNQLLNMQKNGERLIRLMNQLMDFRKKEAGFLKLQAIEGNLVEFLKEIHVSFREYALEKGIDFKFESEQREIRCWFDQDMLEKVFFNLLSNAFKFTPNKGKITLRVCVGLKDPEATDTQYTETGKYVKISVLDTGRGIADQHLKNIFDRYYSVQKANPKSERGIGIGLALSKELVQLHHGQIKVESELNKGTDFSVWLPTGNTHLKEDEMLVGFIDSEHENHYQVPGRRQEQVQEAAADVNVNKESPLILIVEDNKSVKDFIQSLFSEEYQVLLASDGKEGLAMATTTIPDLIISDVMMPEMDGMELCRQLKTNEKTSHIPIILLTARTSLIYKTEGLETGADDYITKPFEPSLLLLRVKNLINLRKQLKKRSQGKLYLKPADITINSVDEIFLQKAMDLVEKHMDDSTYSVEDFSKDLAMSRVHLYRKLKALVGQSANEFIRTQRLQRAAQLLEKSQLRVAEVAYMVGFNDLKYFRGCFVKQFQVTPSQYASKFDQSLEPSEK